MVFAAAARMLVQGAGRIDLRDPHAARDTVAVAGVQPPPSDVVGRIHHHRDDVFLPDVRMVAWKMVRVHDRPERARLYHLQARSVAGRR